MLKTFILLLFLFPVSLLQSQNTISGTIKDGRNDKPLEFAQVALMEVSDSALVTGGITNMQGEFAIETSRRGEFLLRLSFIGYEEQWLPITVVSGNNDTGEIQLSSAAHQLGEVEVSAAAMLFRSEADRRIFNVEQMTVADGGTAIQLLETLPSVQVDEEGRISLRGSGNILIYINGRPTNMTADDTESVLEQYPANAIKEVELITNPSARYEAEGVGGIINIILKDERHYGFNGQVTMSSGTGNKYSAGFNMNYRMNNWNFNTSYSGQYREMWEMNNSFRQNFAIGRTPVIDQDYYTENWRRSHLLRAAAEYNLNRNTSARLYGNVNMQNRDRERLYNIRNLDQAMVTDSIYVRNLNEDQSQVNYETGLDFVWQNDNETRFRAAATLSINDQDRIEYFDQTQTYFNTSPHDQVQVNQFYSRPQTGNMLVLQADFDFNPLEDTRLETGLRAELRFDDRSQHFGQISPLSGDTLSIVINGLPVTNAFNYNRNIYAAYASFADNRNRLSYLLGIRAEYTLLENWQDFGLSSGFLDDDNFTPGRDITNRDHHFGLFPSVFLSYSLSENQDIQANYSRRIRRPWAGSMSPFLNAQDFYNLRLGNPYLQPQHTDNFELNYIRSWSNYMFTGGVFHRYTTNGFTRLFVLFDQGSMVTWTNANTQNSTGAEIINYFTFANNFDATLTTNFFHSQVSGEVEGRAYSNSNYSWNMNLMSNYNIRGWFSTQLSANYWGPRVIPQGSINPVFSMNIGLRRNVLNNQGTISLNLSDVFNTRKFAMEINDPQFYQLREFTRESRIFTLSFTYRFRDFRERNSTGGRSDGGDGDTEGLF
jgi:iron complex outermembrane recepter protein